MKSLFVLALSLLLVLSFAACGTGGQAPASEPKNSSPPISEAAPGPEPDPEPNPASQRALDETPGSSGEDDPSPQANVALVREIVFTYGAEEDTLNQPGVIVMKKKSLFLREESWSGENGLTPDYYLYWENSLPQTEEEWDAIQAEQHYAEGRQGESPFGYFYLGPGEVVEEKILSHFEVTLEHLRSDPEYYDGSIPGYFFIPGGGLGERPIVSFTWEQEGDILTIPVTLTSHSIFDGSEQEDIHTLTVRLELGGGWKYLGCQVA